MLWLLLSLASAAPAWNDVVVHAVDPMSPRQLPADRELLLGQLCGGGVDAACQWLEGADVPDLLATRCEDSGDSWSCLAAAWAQEPEAPEVAFAAYDALCDAGSRRACADVARAALDGIGTWQSRRRARRLAEPLCAAGQREGCLVMARLEQRTRPLVAEQLVSGAVASEAAFGLLHLSELVREEQRWGVLVRACEAGMGAACHTMAMEKREQALEDVDDDDTSEDTTPDDASDASDADDATGDDDAEAPTPVADMSVYELLDRSCELEHISACRTAVLIAVDHEELPRKEGRERLEELCDDGDDDACLEADYLRFGGDVRAFKLGSIHPLFVERLGTHLTPQILDCYRDQLDRQSDFDDPEMVIHAWIDEDGIVAGGTVRTSGPLVYKECVAERVMGHEIVEGGIGVSPDHAVKVEVPIHFGHEAEIKITPVRAVAGLAPNSRALSELAYDEWLDTADACWLENEGSAWDSIFTIRKATIRRDGTLSLGKLFESSSIEAVDACLAEMMSGVELDSTFEYDEKVRIYIRFVQPFRHPKPEGFGHGEAKDPDLYMNREDWGEGG